MSRSEVDWMFSNTGYARLDPSTWREFVTAINSTDRTPRETLHRYYDWLLGNDPNRCLQAARSWMQYEMKVMGNASTSFYERVYAPVAVYDGESWSWTDGSGRPFPETDRAKLNISSSVLDVVDRLCVSLPLNGYANPEHHSLENAPRPVRTAATANADATSPALPTIPNFIPAQNMLTCFYSVNDRFALNHLDLLQESRMSRMQHIRCIAVHGGLDKVCPVNTALHLSKVWRNLELRIPLQSSHSMYDAAITNELVKATDRMAQLFRSL